jgi:hypothetical protein
MKAFLREIVGMKMAYLGGRAGLSSRLLAAKD